MSDQVMQSRQKDLGKLDRESTYLQAASALRAEYASAATDNAGSATSFNPASARTNGLAEISFGRQGNADNEREFGDRSEKRSSEPDQATKGWNRQIFQDIQKLIEDKRIELNDEQLLKEARAIRDRDFANFNREYNKSKDTAQNPGAQGGNKFASNNLSAIETSSKKDPRTPADKPNLMVLLADLQQSESGMLVRDLMNRAANPPDPSIMDTRPQSPLLGPLQNTGDLNVQEIYDKVKDSTFKVLNHNLEAIGSGSYACSRDGKACAVVTNYHVGKLGPIDGTIYLQSENQIYLGKIVSPHSAANDLALIEPLFPESAAANLKPVEIGPAPAKSDSVLSVAYPSSKLAIPVLSAGKVTNPDGQVHVNDGLPGLSPLSILTDQSIYGGASGGPEFDKNGRYIGVTRANGSEGTVVIKADHVLDLLDAYEKTLAGQK